MNENINILPAGFLNAETPGNTPTNLQSLSLTPMNPIMASPHVTLYGEEFCETSYPDNEAVYPSQWPTFYPDYPDTVWIRRSFSKTCVSESSDVIRFNLNKDLPSNKDLVIDSLELLLCSVDSGLTMELYLDNSFLISLPYSLSTITNIDLKSLGVSEEERTLSYRKNIMVKFSKNGRPYLKMGVCCASFGLPAGHIRGRLKDRDQTGTPRPLATYQYLTDHNKNVTGLADEEGNLVATWDYDAFGNIIRQTGPMASSNPLRFSSEYHDEDLGLIYYNYRHYNPKDGRWISRDPIEEKDDINTYKYLYNNPIVFNDALGLSCNIETSASNCTITITMDIDIYFEKGCKPNPGGLNTIASSIKLAIERYWNGFSKGCCKVKVKANVTAQKEKNGFWHRWNNPKENNIGISDSSDFRSYVNGVGGNSGIWGSTAAPWVYAHEAGHLMGLDDDYSDYTAPDGTVCSQAHAGHEGHMMAEYGGTVDQHEIEAILKNVKCPCNP